MAIFFPVDQLLFKEAHGVAPSVLFNAEHIDAAAQRLELVAELQLVLAGGTYSGNDIAYTLTQGIEEQHADTAGSRYRKIHDSLIANRIRGHLDTDSVFESRDIAVPVRCGKLRL
jgi:hypothetical protein